jgi:hypothetical protein
MKLREVKELQGQSKSFAADKINRRVEQVIMRAETSTAAATRPEEQPRRARSPERGKGGARWGVPCARSGLGGTARMDDPRGRARTCFIGAAPRRPARRPAVANGRSPPFYSEQQAYERFWRTSSQRALSSAPRHIDRGSAFSNTTVQDSHRSPSPGHPELTHLPRLPKTHASSPVMPLTLNAVSRVSRE